MRQVNIRKLRKDLATELKDLPFEIVRNGVVVGVVSRGEVVEVKAVVSEKPKSDLRAKWKESHPREWCSACGNYNKDCVCGV